MSILRARVIFRIGLALAAAGMVLALFIPWGTVKGSSQGLAEYAAPTPSIIAWVLLALGLAVGVVAGVSFVTSGRKALPYASVGGILYLVGAMIWYFSTILPDLVASGCVSNPGSLCSFNPGNPTAEMMPSIGFVVGLVSAGGLLVISLVAAISESQAADHQSDE